MILVVDGQRIYNYEYQEPHPIATNSLGFIDIEFRMSEEWDGYICTAQFVQHKENGADFVASKVLYNNHVTFPDGIIPGVLEISLFGYKAGEAERGTTFPYIQPVCRSGFTSTEATPIPPTPDLYSQFLQSFETTKQSIENNKQIVQNASKDAITARDSAVKAAETAVAAAKSAQSNLDSIKQNTEQAITDIQTEGSTQRRSVTSTGDAQNQRVMDTGAEQSRALDAQGATERQKVAAAGDEQVSRVTNAGNGAVESVTLEKTNAINGVQSAKTEAVNSVETAKTSAVEAVKSAESAAIQNIGTGVDDTLSISGKAADAKKTGDSISSLKDDLDSKFYAKESVNLWNPETTVIGQLQTNGTLKTDNTEYVATDFIPYRFGEQIWVCYFRTDTKDIILSTPQASTGSCLVLYDKNRNFLEYADGSTLLSNGRGYTIKNTDCRYIRLGYAYAHWANAVRIYCISKVNIENVEDFEEYYSPIVYLKNVNDPSNPTKVSELENDEGYIRESKYLNANIVSCRGDSLTDGAGATSGNTYPKLLKDLLGENYTVNNFGVGGEGTKAISWRFGATPIYLAPCTIPESGSVDCRIVDASGADVTFLLRGGMIPSNPSLSNFNVNPVVIGGIEGVLARKSTTENAYTFTRNSSGQAVTLDWPTFISTYGYRNNTKDITVFWCGTNDTQSWKGYMYIINYLKQMVDLLPHKNYIVCGLTCLNLHSDIATKNEQLSLAFGRHFLDLRYYLLNYGLADAGITPTEEDETAIASGEMPPSLLYDNMHFNSNGYAVIANCIYRKGVELGYW